MVFVLVLASFFMTAFDIREHFLFIHDTCRESELKARKPVHYKHDFGMQCFHDHVVASTIRAVCVRVCVCVCVCACVHACVRLHVSANFLSVIYQQFPLP